MDHDRRKEIISWDECFMRIARTIALRSKDPSTQTGAVVVDENNIVLGVGYNGFPKGTDGFPWAREGDPLETKYMYVCHAEENAIYNAQRITTNAKIYTTLFPCNECAKAIIQNGIRHIIFESNIYKDQPIYQAAYHLCQAAQVSLRQYVCGQKDYHSPLKTPSDLQNS